MNEQTYTRNPATIEAILNDTRTIAVVGLSSRLERAGHYVPAYLQQAGYRIIPVNPSLDQALGEKAYPDLQSVTEAVDLVLIFQPSENVQPFVEQAIAIGARAVWMQQGIYNQQAAETAQQAGLMVVMDTCMMGEHQKRFRR